MVARFVPDMFVLKFKTAARQTFDRGPEYERTRVLRRRHGQRGFRVRTLLELGALPAIADRSAEGGCLLGLQEWDAGLAAREGRFDYLLVEPLPAAEPRLGRRTALSLPLFPPPT